MNDCATLSRVATCSGSAPCHVGGAGAFVGRCLLRGRSAAEVVQRVFGGRRRSRAEGGRPHKFTVRFTDEEFQAVALKATAARVSIPHYLALRALETPRGGAMDLRVLPE